MGEENEEKLVGLLEERGSDSEETAKTSKSGSSNSLPISTPKNIDALISDKTMGEEREEIQEYHNLETKNQEVDDKKETQKLNLVTSSNDYFEIQTIEAPKHVASKKTSPVKQGSFKTPKTRNTDSVANERNAKKYISNTNISTQNCFSNSSFSSHPISVPSSKIGIIS
jgi:hypothetical protein